MSDYTLNVNIKWLAKEDLWITTKPLQYYTYVFWKRAHITVPKGFKFDWASVPRFLWSIYPPMSAKNANASCIHDYLFKTKQYSLWKTDLIFLEALEVAWMGFIRRYVMFYWLKLWSWYNWYIKPLLKWKQ